LGRSEPAPTAIWMVTKRVGLAPEENIPLICGLAPAPRNLADESAPLRLTVAPTLPSLSRLSLSQRPRRRWSSRRCPEFTTSPPAADVADPAPGPRDRLACYGGRPGRTHADDGSCPGRARARSGSCPSRGRGSPTARYPTAEEVAGRRPPVRRKGTKDQNQFSLSLKVPDVKTQERKVC
jgi:hypothetical protein